MINVNEYYDGNIKSLGNTLNGEKFTVGIMEAGSYTFGTDTVEIMEIVFGEMEVEIPGTEKKLYVKGDKFEVAKGVDFKVTIKDPVAYLCLYK